MGWGLFDWLLLVSCLFCGRVSRGDLCTATTGWLGFDSPRDQHAARTLCQRYILYIICDSETRGNVERKDHKISIFASPPRLMTTTRRIVRARANWWFARRLGWAVQRKSPETPMLSRRTVTDLFMWLSRGNGETHFVHRQVVRAMT
jgi:hypothetical protein